MSNQVNPMMEKLTQNNTNTVINNIQQLKMAVNKLASANTRDAFNSMAEKVIASNPMLKPYIQKYGMNFMQAFKEEAKARGVNPDDILKALQQ